MIHHLCVATLRNVKFVLLNVKISKNKLFGLILTDRGTEFARPQLFEINHETGG